MLSVTTEKRSPHTDQTGKTRYEVALIPVLNRLCAPGLAGCFILATVGNNSCMPLNPCR